MVKPFGQEIVNQGLRAELYRAQVQTSHSEIMNRYSAKDLQEGSRIRYRCSDGWKQSNIYKASEKFIWFRGMGVARMKRVTFDIYPDKYEILDL